MQCPKCQSPIETGASGAPDVCAACGAFLKDESSSVDVPAARSRISIGGIFWSLLFVVLATLAAGSTFVALRMGEDRKLAREELSRATKTIDQMTEVVSNNGLLKGHALEPARQELLQPVLEYNQAIVSAHAADKAVTGEATAAKFRIAALQAKLGSKDSVETLGDAINMLCTMNENPATDLDTFPSLHANLLKIAAPTDWMAVKGATFEDMRNHGLKLYFDLVGGVGALKSLHEKHPQSINFTDDLAALLTSLATLKALIPDQREGALSDWELARDLLETLARDQPAETDYRVRLADVLTTVGRLQKTKKPEMALVSYQRAVDVLEPLVAAAPDDKVREKALTAAKAEVQKLKPAQAAAPEPAAQPVAAE